ncbi:hypothetical protein [Nostoc parmelioides]|uniref:Uncharacterized protein n=1 Tax=Nostoc parmelioides FACHB-3921 TaxID=2692909 RepID=A0ABR8BFR1_9NOSO|nr:hypothetical protein [Nostoc parmelioides]MBD2251798.1 hypothetical protein [Nostoc parmelioides FACHB-3921]
MLPEKHLQRKREALQEQYDISSEKLLELRRNYAIEVDVSVRFKLVKQIEQLEAELDEVAKHLDSIDKTSESERLYYALLKLGYQNQIRSFKKFIDTQSIGAFLIHGSLYYGQRWLLNRLARRHVPQNIPSKNVIVDLSRIARQSDITALWRELSSRVGLGRQSPVSEITERVYKWWQTQNVLLVFHNVHILPEAFLQNLLQDFWLPLAVKAKNAATQDQQYKLLMFLIDYDGCVDSWNMPFVDKLLPTWKPDTPVKLPVITEFSEDELENWLWQGYETEELPSALTAEDVEQIVQIIMQNSDNGIPEPVMEEICRLSGCEWCEEERKWLKL